MIEVVIIGTGHIGHAAREAVLSSSDMHLAGMCHHGDCIGSIKADVAILALPSREIPVYAPMLIERGIATVDSYDIHSHIVSLRAQLMPIAKASGVACITAAGWDPGTDSVVRCLMEAMTPRGITYTNFGPGRSMGHTVAAKAIGGVRDALSMTIPLGTGVHRRMVYIELEEGARIEEVTKAIKADDYFKQDETHVIAVPSVRAIDSVSHGVHVERSGVSGIAHNQRLSFTMAIDNPALTGQVLVSAARATQRLQSGCYTMIEVPPVALLEGTIEDNIASIV